MNKLSILFILAALLLIMGCGNSALEEKVIAYEVAAEPTSQVEILNIQEIGPLTGTDSLNYLYRKYLPGIGLPPSELTEWTPDSMIVQYRKMIAYFQISIGAFEQANTNDPKDPAKFLDFITRYKAEMRSDSSNLARLLYFDARRDSVLALKYECQLKMLDKSGARPETVTKVVVLSKDKSNVLGSEIKLKGSI